MITECFLVLLGGSAFRQIKADKGEKKLILQCFQLKINFYDTVAYSRPLQPRGI